MGALRSRVELADLRYRGGVTSWLEVQEAQRDLFSAELGLSQAQLLAGLDDADLQRVGDAGAGEP